MAAGAFSWIRNTFSHLNDGSTMTQTDDPPQLAQSKYFHFLSAMWDLTEARRRAEELPVHQDTDISVFFRLVNLIDVGREPTADADLSDPVLVVKHAVNPHTVDDAGYIVIDGWDRLAKARSLNLTRLPVKVIEGWKDCREIVRFLHVVPDEHIPADAARPCAKCDGTLVPVLSRNVYVDEGDGSAQVDLRCNQLCGMESAHSWTASDQQYLEKFGHPFGEDAEEAAEAGDS
jgi:hypothetical protein